ncbi:MAG: cysteine--tRNA ligase [Candidatus Vogelbacteria bacterium GWA1_51_14]|uniref:Cysteine--tRNA ligase n=1 Tax=Candidatus Vogelbacteria bacterium GWA1_51_14 TaxID=1802435 RepID=A0A1G2QA59_9BACT|nr:MAG: cysteine--tRNA ligase [Candidatus Vogelbacteria bacterium GWA1_51_14]
MALIFYNQLGKEKQEFTPLRPGEVSMYACGPTVYNYVHLGNFRTFVFEDGLKRVLIYSGLKVKHVTNLTDIDDKIINKANEEGTTVKEIADRYANFFFADLAKLNITPADYYPRATEHLSGMIKLIERLIAGGKAYVEDGSVYFAIDQFPNYGKLSGVKTADLKTNARVNNDEFNKNAPADFVLWKAAKPGEPSYDSPWGPGRPGWHIECSAMSMELLGDTFDLHTGGIDLLFPHHENEIAQSEGATGKPLAHYFLEGEYLMIEGEKMSKSLGNILTLKDIEAKGYSPLDLRYLFLTAKYRQSLNFTWESLAGAKTARHKLNNLLIDLADAKNGNINTEYQNKFREKIEADLNLPQALAVMWELLDDQTVSPADKKATLLDFDRVLGLSLAELKPAKVSADVETLLIAREQARHEGNFAKADQLRAEIESNGWVVDDTADGPKLKQK